MSEQQKLVTISYNLTTEIEKELNEIPLIAIVSGEKLDETLTIARTERTKLNKVIEKYETERKGLNKAINDNFKTALTPAVSRLAKFDENIRDGAAEQKTVRTEVIKAEILELSENALNPEFAPLDDFLKKYDSRKSEIKLWVSKTKSEVETIEKTLGVEAVEDFHKHYNLGVTLSRFAPSNATPVAEEETIDDLPFGDAPSPAPTLAPTFSTFTITVDNSIKAEIIAYLESRGVLVG